MAQQSGDLRPNLLGHRVRQPRRLFIARCHGRRIFYDYIHIAALARSEHLSGSGAVGRNLEKTHAAQDSEDLARGALRVRAIHLRDLSISNNDLEMWGLGLE